MWYLREKAGSDSAGCAHYNVTPDGEQRTELLLPAGIYEETGIREKILWPLAGDRLQPPVFNGFIWRFLFDAAILRDNAITFEGAYLEDELFLMEYFANVHRLAVTDKPLYRYLENPASATHRYMRDYPAVFARFLERKAEIVEKYGLDAARPQWRANTVWAGLLIAVGNEYVKSNPKPVREKRKAVEALCAHRPDIPAKGTEMGNYFRNNIRNYYACITGVDEQVGRIIETLKSNGLFENTIVVFTSDHGICMGAHNNAGKDIFYEESMRIPMIISWPAKIKPRKDDHLMIAFADLYPSLLSLMGFQKEIPETVQTFDLSRHILGKSKKEVVQPYYYVQFDNHATGYRGLRTSTHTFAVHATNGKIDETVLYDRTKDPYQMDNIAGQSPRLVRQFNKQLKAWLLHTNDSFAHYLETVTK